MAVLTNVQFIAGKGALVPSSIKVVAGHVLIQTWEPVTCAWNTSESRVSNGVLVRVFVLFVLPVIEASSSLNSRALGGRGRCYLETRCKSSISLLPIHDVDQLLQTILRLPRPIVAKQHCESLCSVPW